MSERIPLPGPKNFTLGLAGYKSLNTTPNQAGRVVLPVSCQLSYPPTELEIALAEQKLQAEVIALLQQRLEDRDRGMAGTPPIDHPAKPSHPKKARKRTRKSHPAQTADPAASECHTIFERLEHRVRVPIRPRLASVIRAKSSTRSSTTSSTAGTNRTGASGHMHNVTQQRVGPSEGKRPMDLNKPPRPTRTSGHPE